MTSIGCVSHRVPQSAAAAVNPSSTKAIKLVLRASACTVLAMSSRLTARARPPREMPPSSMIGEATQIPRSAGDNRLRLASLTTRP